MNFIDAVTSQRDFLLVLIQDSDNREAEARRLIRNAKRWMVFWGLWFLLWSGVAILQVGKETYGWWSWITPAFAVLLFGGYWYMAVAMYPKDIRSHEAFRAQAVPAVMNMNTILAKAKEELDQ